MINAFRFVTPLPPLLLEFVTIGDAGNVSDTTTYGAVSYTYQIGKYEISEGDIAAYNADSVNNTRQITLDNRGTDKPATSISWNEAARYVNWLNEREGEQPAYKFTAGGVNSLITLWSSAEAWQTDGENLYRHKDAKYFIPSEDEWYKAAYYNGSVYFDYPTGSDTAPTAVASGTTAETAVYVNQSGPADVTQAGGLSPYSTMGQAGNVYEWTESAFNGSNDSASWARTYRGGSWGVGTSELQSSNRNLFSSTIESNVIGFRIARITALNYTWTQIGSDINGTGVGDSTGYRVDLNDAGDIVAMTSPFNTDGGADSGEIRVFERSGNSWVKVGSDIEGAPGDYPTKPGFGQLSVALNGAGDVIATGWPGNDEFGAGNNDSGQVRVYKNVSNTWTLTGGDINPLVSDERLGANEGVSLNTEGNIVAVGSWLGGDQTGFSDPGVVRVFEMNAGTWSQIGQTLSGETTGVPGDYNQSADYSGYSASLNGAGDILVVGAPGNDNNNYPSLNYAGHVRVFRYNTGTWNQIGSDIDGGAAELQFGFSTSINTTGNIIAVGGYGSALNTGIVRIFENITDTWTQIGSDIVGVNADDRTGYSVSLNGAGDIVAVGDVLHDNVSGTNIGRMRTFKNVAGVWEQLAPEVTGLAAGEYAGASVALNKVGDITAVGVIGTSTGSVRMYNGGFS